MRGSCNSLAAELAGAVGAGKGLSTVSSRKWLGTTTGLYQRQRRSTKKGKGKVVQEACTTRRLHFCKHPHSFSAESTSCNDVIPEIQMAFLSKVKSNLHGQEYKAGGPQLCPVLPMSGRPRFSRRMPKETRSCILQIIA